MSTTELASVHEHIAILEEHAETYGLSTEGKLKLEKLQADALALAAAKRKAATTAKRQLSEALDAHRQHLADAVVALEAFVEAREAFDQSKQTCATAERVARQHDALFSTSAEIEAAWSLSTEWRALHDRARGLIGNRLI